MQRPTLQKSGTPQLGIGELSGVGGSTLFEHWTFNGQTVNISTSVADGHLLATCLVGPAERTALQP